MSKTIYIAGKVTGLPFEEVRARFAAEQEQLEGEGYVAINPVALIAHYTETLDLNERDYNPLGTWAGQMRLCIQHLTTADELHLMPCWQDSKGARLERDVALRLEIPIIYL